MARGHYNTRQKSLVQCVLQEMKDTPATVEEILERLENRQEKVGRTTVYRQLEKLEQEGHVRVLHDADMTKYQFVEDSSACVHHLHCRCTECGKLFHVDCDLLDVLQKHLLQEHQFCMIPEETVLLGKCALCSNEQNQLNQPDSEITASDRDNDVSNPEFTRLLSKYYEP